MGDALHAIACAAGYNIRWLVRAMLRLGLKGLFVALNVWLWLMLTMRCSGIGAFARQMITVAASPLRERQFPLVSAAGI